MTEYARGGYLPPRNDADLGPFIPSGCDYIITKAMAERLRPMLAALNVKREGDDR